ncbi:MAG: choice-of-anchor D domain-containing protein, partial [Bacteroidota bacterium]
LSCKLQTCDLGTLTFSAEASGDAFDLNPSNNKVFEKTNVRYIIPSLLGHGEMPDMKTQEDGHVHTVYFSNDDLLYAHKLYQGNWEIEKLATLKEYTGQSCALALDSENKVHIMYSVFDWESSPGGKMYHMWQDEQGEWKKVITAINEKGFSRIKVETDSQDEFHLVYQEGEKWYSYAPVMYMKTIEKEWTAPYLLEQEGYSHVDIVLDEQDKPHVCYYAVNKGIVYHYCQDPDAGTWSQAEIIEPDWGGGQLEGMVNSISLDSEGNPHISYVGNIKQDGLENIKFARKQYGNWTINKVDGGDFGSSGNAVYAEDPGKAHFIYNHFPSGEIRYATNVNGPWIRQTLDDKTESMWFKSTLIDQDLYHNNHLVYEKDENIYYALRRPVPVLEIHPDTLDFGSVPVDDTRKITVFLKNADNRRMTVDSAVINDYDCFDVEKTFEVRLDPGETDGMYVHFSPTSEGLYDTHMKVYYDAPTGIFMEIPILARSEMPLLRVRPLPLDFGAVPENTEETISVYLINEGEKELTFDEITVEKELWGTVYPTDFILVSNTCDALAAGDSCEVVIAFKPQSQGAQYSYLNISSNDPSEPEKQIRIDGRTPVATISLSKSLVDFGYVEIDGTTTEDILINNTGETDIQIYGIVAMQDPDIDQFTVNHSCTVIPPGEACTLTVGFKPTKTGDMEVQISIATNAYPEDTYYITLRGSSVKRELSISSHLIDFGTILTGEEETADITLENAGTTDIIIEQIELTGRDALEFSFQSGCGSLGSGEECTATVKFIPLFDGNKKADLIIHSNDSDHPKDTIILTGIAGSGEGPDDKYSLSGHIYDEGGETPINESVVELYAENSIEPGMQLELSSSNEYEITGISTGIYTVKAIPDALGYPDALPTYLGNELTMADAQYVNVNSDLTGLDINIIQAPGEGSGTGTVEGTFSEDENGQGKTGSIRLSATKGTPISNCYVYLLDPDSQSLEAMDITSGEGLFIFRKLEAGDYEFMADYKGLPMDESNPLLEISSTNDTILVSAVAGAGIIGIEAEEITGIESLPENNLRAYPVPVSDHLTLTIGKDNPDLNVEYIKIIDLNGKVLYEQHIPALAGSDIVVDMSRYAPGIYLLRIDGKNSSRFIKIIKN